MKMIQKKEVNMMSEQRRAIYVVRLGKQIFFRRQKTVFAADTYEEAEKWVYDNLQPGQHMFIEKIDKLTAQDFKDILKVYDIIPMKGDK